VVPQGLLDTARDWASQQIIANTGMDPDDINNLKMLSSSTGKKETPFAARARVLIQEGIITPGANLKDVVKRTKERAMVHGAMIAKIVQELDEHIAEHPDEKYRQPDGATMAERIRTDVLPDLVSPADNEVIQRVERDAAAIGAKGQMTFAQAQDLKRSYDKWIDYTVQQGPLEEALKRVRQIVNRETEDKAEKALEDIDPKKHGEFKDAKERYGNLRRTQEIAQVALMEATTQKNRTASTMLAQAVTAGIAAGIGWLLGILTHVNPMLLATAAGSGGAASMGIKAVSSALGGLSPGVMAPWIYKATDRIQKKRDAALQAATH
jgi:hypothetical protein